jgi:hypothetical protein
LITIFDEKLSLQQNESSVVLWEIFAGDVRTAQKVKVSTSRLFYGTGYVDMQGDSLQRSAGLVHNNAFMKAATFKATLCVYYDL